MVGRQSATVTAFVLGVDRRQIQLVSLPPPRNEPDGSPEASPGERVAAEMVARDHTRESACSQAHITKHGNSVKCLPNHLSPTGSRTVPGFLVSRQGCTPPALAQTHLSCLTGEEMGHLHVGSYTQAWKVWAAPAQIAPPVVPAEWKISNLCLPQHFYVCKKAATEVAALSTITPATRISKSSSRKWQV